MLMIISFLALLNFIVNFELSFFELKNVLFQILFGPWIIRLLAFCQPNTQML